MEKFRRVLAVLILAGLLGGCTKETVAQANTVVVHKDGQITEHIMGDFTQPHYKESVLRQESEDEIASYNAENGEGKVELTELSVENTLARMTVQFKSDEDYTNFNGVSLFAGTMKEAKEANQITSVVLTAVNGKSEPENLTVLAEDENLHLAILEESRNIRTFNNIVYYSSNVSLVNSKEAAAVVEEDQKAYIIFK